MGWLPETATLLEFGWTVFAIVIQPLCLWVLYDAAGDLRQLARPRARDLELLAWRDIAIDGVVFYLLVLLAGVGLRAMSVPPPLDEVDAGAVAVGVGFLGAEVLLCALTLWLVWVRRQVKAINRGVVTLEWNGRERREGIRHTVAAYEAGKFSAEEALAIIIGQRPVRKP